MGTRRLDRVQWPVIEHEKCEKCNGIGYLKTLRGKKIECDVEHVQGYQVVETYPDDLEG